MTDQSRSQFHIALSNFVEEACRDDVWRIFEVFLEQKHPMTLEELAEHVFDEEVPEEDEYFVLEYEDKHDNVYRDTHMREGIAELRGLAIPILKSEDGKYRLGNSIGDIWEMMSSLEDEIKHLNGTLNTMYMNFGRQLETYHDEES
jgi:hypothetical protein